MGGHTHEPTKRNELLIASELRGFIKNLACWEGCYPAVKKDRIRWPRNRPTINLNFSLSERFILRNADRSGDELCSSWSLIVSHQNSITEI